MLHLFPQFLPDGTRYMHLTTQANSPTHAVVIRSLDSGQVVELMRSESMASYAPPHFLLFTRQRTLLAQEFDATTLTLTGEPSPIADGVLYRAVMGRPALAVSEAGTLLYRTGGTETGQRSFVWIDRSRKITGPIGEPILGRLHWAVARTESKLRSVTAETAPFGMCGCTTWRGMSVFLSRAILPSITRRCGRRKAHAWDSIHTGERMVRQASTKRAPTGRVQSESCWRPKLEWAYRYWIGVQNNISSFQSGPPPRGQETRRIVGQTSLPRSKAVFVFNSCDERSTLTKRSLARLRLDEGGTNQVIVQSFPDLSKSRQRISQSGGLLPRWKRDGRELFYLDSRVEADGSSGGCGRHGRYRKSHAPLHGTRLRTASESDRVLL